MQALLEAASAESEIRQSARLDADAEVEPQPFVAFEDVLSVV